jgi:hypothetical protein
MSRRTRFAHAERMRITTAILFFVILLTVIQLWLLTAVLNAELGGDASAAIPAAIASLLCLAVNSTLLGYLLRLE